MSSRDKIIEILKHEYTESACVDCVHYGTEHPICDDCGAPARHEKLLNVVADKLQEVDNWVSVEDRLPVEWEVIQIITDYKKQAVAYYCCDDDGIWHDAMRSIHTYGSVTHWQPLPTPPKEGNK